MATLLNSPITSEFDPHTSPFAPPDPLLDSVGVNHFIVVRLLHDSCPEFAHLLRKAKVQSIKAADICGGRGFLSHILRTTVQFADPTQAPFSFVIKIPTTETFDAVVDSYSSSAGSSGSLAESETSTSSSSSSSSSAYGSVHDTECRFYEAFQEAAASSKLALPRVYYARQNAASSSSSAHRGMILMEDLSARAACVDVFSSLSAAQCLNVAIEVARLQAHFDSMPAEGRQWLMEEECVHASPQKQQFLDEFLARISDYGEEFVQLATQLESFSNVEFAKHALVDRPREEGCATLTHGDMWTNNVMFHKLTNSDEDSGTLSDSLCAFIDFQTAFYGNPLFDLSFLLASSVDAETRRRIARRVVDKYYDTLVRLYKQRGATPKFSREQAHRLYKLCHVQQAPVLGALMCFFGRKMEMNCPDMAFVSAKMAIICERTRAVMKDAVEYARELDL